MTDNVSMWRTDLWANARRKGVKGALIGWFANPGFAVATCYRIAHGAERRGGPFKLVSLLAWRSVVKGYGCYISPKARIGSGLRLPHPVGVVVAETATLGNDITLYQGVTIGRQRADEGPAPVFEDGVVVYANATLIGAIRIGAGAVVAAHAVVLRDVPPGAIAVGAPARIIPAKS